MDVDETVARLELALKAQKVPVFAEFDHDDNARKADMTLRPTHVLVFGNPKVGTKLMQAGQSAGLDLPLRVTVWEDDRAGSGSAIAPRRDRRRARHQGPRDRGDDVQGPRRDRQGGQRLRQQDRAGGMDLAAPAGQHEGRGVELGDDGRAGDACRRRRASRGRRAAPAPRPTSKCTGKLVARLGAGALGQHRARRRGHAAGRLDAQGHELDGGFEREAVEALVGRGEGRLDAARRRRPTGRRPRRPGRDSAASRPCSAGGLAVATFSAVEPVVGLRGQLGEDLARHARGRRRRPWAACG